MKVRFRKDKKEKEVNASYGARLYEQGKAEILPEKKKEKEAKSAAEPK